MFEVNRINAAVPIAMGYVGDTAKDSLWWVRMKLVSLCRRDKRLLGHVLKWKRFYRAHPLLSEGGQKNVLRSRLHRQRSTGVGGGEIAPSATT